MKTKLFTLLLAVAASVGTMFAESGFCGYDLTWNLTGKVLTISGTGAMFDYYSDTTPWYSYRSSITTVIIKDGATSIGVYDYQGWRHKHRGLCLLWLHRFDLCDDSK